MSNETNMILDFTNPDREMLKRDGEDPTFAVVAAIPTHSDLVTQALNQLNAALMLYMDPTDIVLILQDEVELVSGKIIKLGPHSIFFSLAYPTVQSRIFEMELGAPQTAVLH